MKVADVKLRGAAKKLVDEFDDAAQCWGWERDQGSGQRVADAETEYLRGRAALEQFILRLQRRAARKVAR